MPNHVHLVLEPADEGGLARAVAQAHQRYTRHINAREGWTGYLWQGRFSSCAMDEAHALTAVRYVELNPVKARLSPRAQDWAWSSARYHLGGIADGLTTTIDYLARVPDWERYLADELGPDEEARLGYFTETGYPMGAAAWLAGLEIKSSRPRQPRARGRPRLDRE